MTDKGAFATSIERLRSELDNLVEFAVEQGGKAMETFGLAPEGGPFVPAIDVIETSDSILVNVEIPGVNPADVDVTLAGNMLTIAGEKAKPTVGEDDKSHHRERTSGKFTRSVPVPVPVNPDSVKAEAKNGVLAVRLEKQEPDRKQQIQIRVTS